ncbi:MAG: hypothetical protein AB7D00_14505 [Rhodospirillaceae bacterium]
MTGTKALVIHPLEHMGGGDIRSAFRSGDPLRLGFAVARLPSWLTAEQRQEIGAEFAAAHQMLAALEGVLPYMEAAEAAGLVGDEGCHWPVEAVREAIAAAKGGRS